MRTIERRSESQGPHQFMRIRLVSQPAGIVAGRRDQRHAIVDFGHQFVGIRPEADSFQFSQSPPMPNGRNFLLILQCRQAPHRFRAQAGPSAAGGYHPSTTRMSLGGGECRVGRAAARLGTIIAGAAPKLRRSIGTNKPSTSAAGDRPLPHTAPHKLLAQVEHPAGRSRMLVAVHGLADLALSPVHADGGRRRRREARLHAASC
ncbi:MAG: hypothetical protein WBW06_07565, partial [Xanthobacteraceae bacterium]